MNVALPGGPGRAYTRRQALALGAGLAALAAGCGGPGQIRLGIAFGSQSLWRYLAARKDELLTPSGYQTIWTAYDNDASARKAFQDGALDILATQPTATPLLQPAGGAVQLFMAIAWVADSLPIVTLAELPIQSLDGIPGKRLWIGSLDDPGVAYWRALWLGTQQSRLEERVQIVTDTGDGNAPQALVDGRVDAAMVNSTIWSAIKPSGRFRALGDLSTQWQQFAPGAPPLIFGGYLARKSWLDSNRKFVEDFLRINRDALTRYKAAPDAFLRTVADNLAPPVGAQSVEQAGDIATYLGLQVANPDRVYIGDSDVADFTKIYGLLARAGYLQQAPASPADLFSLSANRPR